MPRGNPRRKSDRSKLCALPLSYRCRHRDGFEPPTSSCGIRSNSDLTALENRKEVTWEKTDLRNAPCGANPAHRWTGLGSNQQLGAPTCRSNSSLTAQVSWHEMESREKHGPGWFWFHFERSNPKPHCSGNGIAEESEESGNGPWRMITGRYACPTRV